MTITHFANMARVDEAVITLNLNGESILHSVANGNTATAGIVISDTLSRVEKNEGGSYTQIDAATGDWATPNPDPTKYEVKAVVSGLGDPNPTSGPTLGAWHTIDQPREWQNVNSTNDSEVKTQLTITVRKIGDASTEVSGIYTINATVGTPV